jgi:hypothetical protein
MIWKCGKCWCTASHGLVGTQAHVLEESNGLAALLDVVNGCYCKAVNAMLLDLLRIKERWQQQGGGGHGSPWPALGSASVLKRSSSPFYIFKSSRHAACSFGWWLMAGADLF